MRVNFTIAALVCGAFSTAQAQLPSDYQSWSGESKQEYLWSQKIAATPWQKLPDAKGLGWGGILKSLKSLGSLGQSFDHTSDEMPSAREKLLHPYGSVAKVVLQADPSNPFTGIYQGAVGLVRLSLAGDQRAMGYTPGMGLKFFVDGAPSVNLHVMNDLAGQGADTNFFAKTFTNILPAPQSQALKLAVWYFGFFVKDPKHLPVNHLARVDARGVVASQVRAPVQLFFVPLQSNRISSQSQRDFRTELGEIPAGTPLYDVIGLEKQGGALIYIGRVVTQSPFVASRYGDHNLFFQHQR